MQFRRSPSVRAIDSQWHKERQRAREVAANGNLDVWFSDAEQVKYNLDTARIDGSDHPRNFKFVPVLDVLGISGTDVREMHNR